MRYLVDAFDLAGVVCLIAAAAVGFAYLDDRRRRQTSRNWRHTRRAP